MLGSGPVRIGYLSIKDILLYRLKSKGQRGLLLGQRRKVFLADFVVLEVDKFYFLESP